MKTEKKIAVVLLAALIAGMAASCASTGQYMPISKEEAVVGSVQATFVVRSSLFMLKSAKDAVNTQSYIKLMEVAGDRYSGSVDIRDIEWVTGRSVDTMNTEIAATGKVVKLD